MSGAPCPPREVWLSTPFREADTPPGAPARELDTPPSALFRELDTESDDPLGYTSPS
jgi:hypothetical protein